MTAPNEFIGRLEGHDEAFDVLAPFADFSADAGFPRFAGRRRCIAAALHGLTSGGYISKLLSVASDPGAIDDLWSRRHVQNRRLWYEHLHALHLFGPK